MHRELNLNFVTDGPFKVVRVVQGDTGRILIITLVDKAAGTITAARIYAHKPDGHEVYNNCTIQNGEITVTLTAQMLAVVGDVICQLRITDANGYITSYAFILKVEKSYVDSSAIESSNEWKTLEAALGSVDQIKALYESAFSAGRVVNSTSQMTDQSTTYILRSSGVIYYYNGTSWTPLNAYVLKNEEIGRLYPGSSHGEIFNDYLNNIAEGGMSAVSGSYNECYGRNSHVTGQYNVCYGRYSVVGGTRNINGREEQKDIAMGCNNSVLLGRYLENYGYSSFLGGYHNTNNTNYATILGSCAEIKPGMLFELGNGTRTEGEQGEEVITRSNALEIDFSGNAKFTGKVKAQSPSESNDLTTKSYVDNQTESKVKKGLEASLGIAIGDLSIAGDSDTANDNSLAVGMATAMRKSIAIGNSIDCEADNGAIQIGESETKADNGEFKVKDYQLMNANGKIPEARIPDSIINGTIKFVDYVNINTSADGVYMTKRLEGSDGGIVDNKYFLTILQTIMPFAQKNAIAFFDGKMYVSYGQEPKVAYSDVVDNSENAPTCQAVQNYVDSHSSSGWQKIADITVNSETAGVGTGAISVPLNDLRIKNANRFMVVIQPFTTEAKPANSITLNAYIRPETGTYYSLPIFNAPSNNLTTKANSLNYAMSVGDIANNGTADAIAMVISHGLTQYANSNSDTGNTRHGTYSYNASRVDNSHLPFLHLIASGYEWEAGSKASLYIM